MPPPAGSSRRTAAGDDTSSLVARMCAARALGRLENCREHDGAYVLAHWFDDDLEATHRSPTSLARRSPPDADVGQIELSGARPFAVKPAPFGRCRERTDGRQRSAPKFRGRTRRWARAHHALWLCARVHSKKLAEMAAADEEAITASCPSSPRSRLYLSKTVSERFEPDLHVPSLSPPSVRNIAPTCGVGIDYKTKTASKNSSAAYRSDLRRFEPGSGPRCANVVNGVPLDLSELIELVDHRGRHVSVAPPTRYQRQIPRLYETPAKIYARTCSAESATGVYAETT